MTKSQGKATDMPLCWLSQNLIFHAISSALKKWNVTSVLKAISRWPFISYGGSCFYSPSTVHIAATVFTFICNKLSLLHETLNDTMEDWSLKYILKCHVRGIVHMTTNLDLLYLLEGQVVLVCNLRMQYEIGPSSWRAGRDWRRGRPRQIARW